MIRHQPFRHPCRSIIQPLFYKPTIGKAGFPHGTTIFQHIGELILSLWRKLKLPFLQHLMSDFHQFLCRIIIKNKLVRETFLHTGNTFNNSLQCHHISRHDNQQRRLLLLQNSQQHGKNTHSRIIRVVGRVQFIRILDQQNTAHTLRDSLPDQLFFRIHSRTGKILSLIPMHFTVYQYSQTVKHLSRDLGNQVLTRSRISHKDHIQNRKFIVKTVLLSHFHKFRQLVHPGNFFFHLTQSHQLVQAR